jgi:hypothetical protein
MRALAALALLPLLSGCLVGPDPLEALADCRAQAPREVVYYFGPGMGLQPDRPAQGFEPGSAFLTDDLAEWLSEPMAKGLWLLGNVTVEYWVRSTGTPAPIVLGGAPGEGYHFFMQFGSDRSLQPSYAVEYSTAIPTPGTLDHHTNVLEMPPGGFVVERGDRLRVLLTDLALDNPQGGGGHEVLYGGQTPSQVRFMATCYPDLEWSFNPAGGLLATPIVIPANQGLLTGGVPASMANQVSFPFTVPPGPHRLTITLEQVGDRNPVKDDMDIMLLDSSGNEAWSIGSPYSNESGTLWPDNLAEVFPDGRMTIVVNSYSGVAYQGLLNVTAEQAS